LVELREQRLCLIVFYYAIMRDTASYISQSIYFPRKHLFNPIC